MKKIKKLLKNKNFLNNQNYIKDSCSYLYYDKIKDYKWIWFFYIIWIVFFLPFMLFISIFFLIVLIKITWADFLIILLISIFIGIILSLTLMLIYRMMKYKFYYSKENIIIYFQPYIRLKNEFINSSNIEKYFKLIIRNEQELFK